MNTGKLNLILHPVRLRILTAISGREMTAQQLSKVLSDVAVATLYRHINTLQEGGLLAVVDEQQIRGTVERTYGISDEGLLNLTPEDIKDATKEDHIRYFTMFIVSLIAEFSAYLQARDNIDLVKDGVGYNTEIIHMTDDEVIDFSKVLHELVTKYGQPTPERKRRQFSIVILPTTDLHEDEQ